MEKIVTDLAEAMNILAGIENGAIDGGLIALIVDLKEE